MIIAPPKPPILVVMQIGGVRHFLNNRGTWSRRIKDAKVFSSYTDADITVSRLGWQIPRLLGYDVARLDQLE